MTTRQHALFTTLSLGPDLEITQGGEVIQPGADSLSNARTARASVGQSVGAWNVELMAWGTAVAPIAPDALSAVVGIVTEDADLSDYVGADAYGIGYDLAAGDILSGGSVVATVGPAFEGDIIGVAIDMAAATVTFAVNGTPVHTEAFSSSIGGGPVYPAASMGSGDEADGRIFMNAGQRAFEYPVADSSGWYSIPTTIDTIRFSEGATYYTAETDSIPNLEFLGVIGQASVNIVRGLNFWTWGSTRSRGSAAEFVVNNPLGEFDSLIEANVRDLDVTLHEIANASLPFSSATLIGSFVLERVTVVDDGRLKLTLREKSAVLDQPLQTRLYLPNAPEEIANRPVQICIGACRSVTPTFLREDSSGLQYQAADTACSFGQLRDSGDLLLLPDDWSVLPGAQVISLVAPPAGKLTLDVSSVGGEGGTTPPATNFLPAALASYSSSIDVSQTVPGSGIFLFGGTGAITGEVFSLLQLDSVLTAGTSYRLSFSLTMPAGVADDGTPRRFSVGQGVSADFLQNVVFSATGTGVYTETFTAAITGPITFALRGLPGSPSNNATMIGATCIEVLDIQDLQVAAIRLPAFVREILGRRKGYAESQWSSADLDAIDAETGYGLGLLASEPINVEDVLQAALVGFSACTWQDSAGVLRFARLRDPADDTPVGTITADEMLADLIVTPDDAPGLTAQIAGQRNWTVLDATDFVSDYDDVPIALRKLLGRRFRVTRTTGVPFPSEYAHARGASPPLETLIDEPLSLQAEIDRVGAIYQTVRKRYTVQIPIAALPAYELDEVWTLQYPRYGLQAGKNCLIVEIAENRTAKTAVLTLWG
jgi:hypothetical protein